MRDRRRSVALAVALATGAAGCISADDGPPSMCDDTDDCDHAAGEICAEGVCYGDPPDGAAFAAVLVPPDYRSDLAVTELGGLTIARDGTVSGLDFAPSIEVRGRVLLACPAAPEDYPCGPGASIAAQITIERAAGFPGGPPWRRQVVASAGIGPLGQGFAFRLPRDGATYRVTLRPQTDEARGFAGGPDPAEVAPPRQLTLTATEDQAVEWYVGEPNDLERIIGCVRDPAGARRPFAGMQVTAFGRWTELGQLERASTLGSTDSVGCFDLLVPQKMVDRFDIVLVPAPGSTLPTLRLFDEAVPDPLEGQEALHEITPFLLMPTTEAAVAVRLPVRARGGDAVAGADVHFTTTFATPDQPDAPGRRVLIQHDVQTVTAGPDADHPGDAEARLYPDAGGAARTYAVTIVPPAGSEYAAAWDLETDVTAAGGALPAATLGRRVRLEGSVRTFDGDDLENTPVEVKLSPRFRAAVEDDAVATAAEALPLGTTTTDDDGGFSLWLDRELIGEPAYYELEIKPAFYDGPRWSFDGIEVPSGVEVDLGEVELPEASYARGPIHDPRGSAVPGAELRIYQLPAPAPCEDPDADPATCAAAAILRGTFVSDELGVVRPVLPIPLATER
jgi:hypothetical protein